jgi:DNA-binding XRE family transcriptional regulator
LEGFRQFVEANQGLTQKEMGVILGVSHTTVGQALKKINFTRKKKHTLMKNETRKSDNNLLR